MTSMQPMRFEDGKPMLLAGLRRYHKFADCPRDIPKQWEEFVPNMHALPRVDGKSYGVICKADEQGMEYMCAVEVADFQSVDADVGRLRTDAQHYAVFAVADVASIGAAWQSILHEWLPQSQWQMVQVPDFERYTEEYNPQTQAGGIEIWIPVIKA